MHLHSTQFLITKWPGTIYAPLCFSSCSPTDFSMGMLHFPPLPCWVTDGFSCRQTITAEAFGCIPFCLEWGNKIVIWKWPCCMRASLFVLGFFLLCVAHIRKEYSLNKFSSLNYFRGHMDSHSNDYSPLNLFSVWSVRETWVCFCLQIILMPLYIF